MAIDKYPIAKIVMINPIILFLLEFLSVMIKPHFEIKKEKKL